MKKTIKTVLFILCMIVTMMICSKVQAASASIKPSTTKATVGDSVTVTVTYTAAAWNLSVSGNGVATTPYVGNTEDAKNTTQTKTIKVDTSSAGEKTIYLKGDVSDGDTDETKKINTSVKITVNPKATTPPSTPEPKPEPKPEKATMTKVQVGDKTYTKSGFTVKVANDVTSIKVVPTISNGESYTINDGKSNTVKLEEGTNTIRIKLASGNSYKIYVRREAKVDDTPNVIEEKPEEEVKLLLKSLSIKGANSEEEKIELSYTPEFSAEVFEYSVLLDETLVDITKLDIEAIAQNKDFTVEITGNEELKDGENIITITVKSKDGKKIQEYKITVTKEAKVVPTVAAPIVEVETEVIEPLWNPTQIILITVFTSIIAIMGIAYAVIEYRYTKENKEETKIPYSGINVENEEKVEEMPFAKIGFEKEVEDKKDILKEEKEPEAITKPKRGKHF